MSNSPVTKNTNSVVVTDIILKEIAQKVVERKWKQYIVEDYSVSALRKLSIDATNHALSFEKKIIDALGLLALDDMDPDSQMKYLQAMRGLQSKFVAAIIDAVNEVHDLPKESKEVNPATKGTKGSVASVNSAVPSMKPTMEKIPSVSSPTLTEAEEEVGTVAARQQNRANQPPTTEKKSPKSTEEVVKQVKEYATRNPEMAYEVASQGLQELGTRGSGRAAFKLNDKIALKIALNSAGRDQNKGEVEVCKAAVGILPQIVGSDPSGAWLEVERADELKSPSEFSATGMEWNDFIAGLDTILKPDENKDKTSFEKVKNNSMFRKLINAIRSCDYYPGDIYKLSSWGKTADNKILLIDYGLTQAIIDKHYTKIKGLGLMTTTDLLALIRSGHATPELTLSALNGGKLSSDDISFALKKKLLTQKQVNDAANKGNKEAAAVTSNVSAPTMSASLTPPTVRS